MSEFTALADESFTTCDSPSGSSTSEPHEDNNGQSLSFTPIFQKANPLFDNNLLFMQSSHSPATTASSPNTTFTPSFVDPFLPNSNSVNEPNFWPDYNNAIPELAKNFTSQMVTDYQRLQNTNMPGMQIRVLGVPQTGAKSRVETQIKLCIQLVTDDGDKAQRWSHLKLPGDIIAKDKLKRQILLSNNGTTIANMAGLDNTTLQPENMLYLTARVICASDPTRKVTTCAGCIQRERKRSQRRKDKKIDAEENRLEDEMIEQKVLLFNCSEIIDFSSGDAILPTRITCYCRHHNERVGFCIYFEMNDYTGQRVASGMSPPIMITDDHKSNKVKTRKRLRTELDNNNSSSSSSIINHNNNNSNNNNNHRFTSFDSRQSHYQIQPRPTSSVDVPIPERPMLQRLIPSEGPTFGGIEITLLGSGFHSGLTCMFGDVVASSTQYWSPNTLVCVLPPASDAGTVVVSFKEYPLVAMEGQEVNLFTYYHENDRALMELALQVVGLKMTGKVEDAREIAMRIVQGGGSGGGGSGCGAGDSTGSQQSANLEQHIMQVLEVMTTFRHVYSEDVSITSAQGHTMLHLAAMLGFAQLTNRLIDLGCYTNTLDMNGYTALHYAAWNNHREVVRILLQTGLADPDITNKWDKKPIQLTKDADIQCLLSIPVECDTDLSSNESVWLGDIEYSEESDTSWGSYLSDSDLSIPPINEGLRHRHPLIQYLNDTETASFSPEEIIDAEPLESIDPPTDDDEKQVPKEKNWMQRTLSHFQPTNSNDLLQNIKNTIPAKPTDLNIKNIADHILQFPSRPASMMSGLFSTKTNEQEEPPAETLAWYMALAYAMGARSLVSEDEKEEQPSTSHEECTIIMNKRRDRRLYSFWVPMLCLMIVWLIFQFVSSHPGVVDTIISLSGFRRQYLTIH